MTVADGYMDLRLKRLNLANSRRIWQSLVVQAEAEAHANVGPFGQLVDEFIDAEIRHDEIAVDERGHAALAAQLDQALQVTERPRDRERPVGVAEVDLHVDDQQQDGPAGLPGRVAAPVVSSALIRYVLSMCVGSDPKTPASCCAGDPVSGSYLLL